MDFNVILVTMGVLFLIVIVGYICGKTRLMNQQFSKGLSNLIVNLTCPLLIMSSTMGDRMPDRSLIVPLLGIGTVTYVILLSLARWLPKVLRLNNPCSTSADQDEGLYSFMLAFGNVGFIGYPVVASIFGPEAVFYASVLNVPNTITVYIWGAQFIAGREAVGNIWARLYSPGLIGTYISILIVAFGWRTPQLLSQSCTLVGNITVPGSLLIIGYSISQIPARHMAGGWQVWLMTPFRLILLPLVVWGMLHGLDALLPFLSLDATSLAINTLIIAMPVASFGTIFCLKYGRDETAMAQGTFLTTLLALATIPLVAWIIQQF